MVPSFYGGDDLIWVFGPEEGSGRLIVLGQEAVDRGLKIGDGPEHTAFQPPLRELGEEALHGIEPGARGWGEVEYPARMPLKPGQHLWVFVGGVVINNGVDDLAGRNLRLNGVEEADELLMAVALHVLAGHGAVEDVEGGEQRCGAVALVIVRHGSAPAHLHRQAGLGTVQSLDLALFIDGEYERVCGRRHIEPNDILELLDEFWVFGQLELPETVGLQAVAAPDALHRTGRDANGPSHGGRSPVRDLAGRRAEGQFDHPRNGFLQKRRLAGGARLVPQKAIHALAHIAFLPAPDAGLGLARPLHDLRRAAADAREQDNIGPPNVFLRAVAIRSNRLKPGAIRRANLEGNSSAHASRFA